MKKINKDLIISVLIVICIVLIISIVFYDKISLSKIIPESEEYTLTTEMQEDLNKTYTEDSKEVITTYHIDASDLKKYENTKEYNRGKQNPFAVESDTVEGNIINGNEIENTSSTNSNNFYDDEGIK